MYRMGLNGREYTPVESGRPLTAQRAGPAVPEMLRLLHQYAAGFVRSPDPSVLAALRQPGV